MRNLLNCRVFNSPVNSKPVVLFMLLSLGSTAQLDIRPLSDSVYVYTTYKNISGKPFPSNSVYYLTKEGIVMIDTPWDRSQLLPLIDSMEARHSLQPVMSISTHFHEDRTAGVDLLDSLGIKTYSSYLTAQYCTATGEEIPEYYFLSDTAFVVGGKRIETFYPGAGHAPDNIVVYLRDERILVGGCMIKSYEATGLGYTGDADIPSWLEAVKEVRRRYRKTKIVVTGHEGFANRSSIKHTIRLLKSDFLPKSTK